MKRAAALSVPGADYYPGFNAWDLGATDPGGRLSTFGAGDETRSWQLDFHYPAGIMPLSHTVLEALYAGARHAAAELPVAASEGLSGRLVGPHVYTSGIPVRSPAERVERAARATRELTGYAEGFAVRWRDQAASLQQRFRRVSATDPGALVGTEFLTHLEDAVELCAYGWRLHFEVMYRLLSLHDDFQVMCRALGISDVEGACLLPSGRTAIRAADVEMWRLAEFARRSGLTALFAGTGDERLHERLRDDEAAATWFARFEAFLGEYGQRADAVADVGAPSWSEHPARPLALIRSWVLGNGTDPDRATEDSLTQQQVTLDAIRARLSGADRRTFDRGLETALAANFAWWNEEHNAHIDLRLHLPLRRAGRALGARCSSDPDSGLFLFTDEVRLLASGAASWADYAPLVDERRRWRAEWVARRPQLPRTVGSVDASEPDPVMREVIGVRPSSGAFPTSTTLTGLPVSGGTARGRARLVLCVDDLALVEPGDVLVCEASSPSWTPVFARVAGCVCDSGGALTHAAIICREYAIPCVCAVGIATRVIRNGDVIELDGTAGTITLIRTQP